MTTRDRTGDESYLTVAAGTDVTAELEVSRSRFLTVLRRVDTQEQARALVEQQRKARHDAGHHCSAFVLGRRGEITRSNDDGEPSGTAGAPILQALLGAGLSDVAAVVTRYFGGILLGTGGLVRAYAGATTLALTRAPLVRRVRRRLLGLSVPYDSAGRVEAELRARGVTIRQVDYLQTAVFTLVDDGRTSEVVAAVTAGQGLLVEAGDDWADLPYQAAAGS